MKLIVAVPTACRMRFPNPSMNYTRHYVWRSNILQPMQFDHIPNENDERKRTPSPPLRGQAASDRALSGLQFQGSNWSMRLLGCSGMRWSTSVSHACGSRPFILAVSMRV